MKKETIDEIKSSCRICFCLLIVLYFVTGYVGTIYRIEGSSMNPLLQDGDRVVSNRIFYKVRDIRHGDVAVFYSPAEPRKYFIKRIIGLPGETIEIRHGDIYIDNRRLDESFIPEAFKTVENLAPTIIPLGYYFVAGDHRNVSNDSRAWIHQAGHYPFVPERYIQGKIQFRVWPLTRFGALSSPDSGTTPAP